MAPCPIPSAAIDRWIARNGYTDQDGEGFRRCIRAMDAAFMDDTQEPMTEGDMSKLLAGLSKG